MTVPLSFHLVTSSFLSTVTDLHWFCSPSISVIAVTSIECLGAGRFLRDF